VTSTPVETQAPRTGGLGTLLVMSWSREAPEGTIPYILACPRGDGPDGPEAESAAAGQLLANAGIPVQHELVDAARTPSLPVTLLVLPGAAVLTLPQVTAQFVPPADWLAAAAEHGCAYLIFTTRPWPADAEPGDVPTLAGFTSAEATLKSAAHVVLPVRKLRG
jgi:hypothetical protein